MGSRGRFVPQDWRLCRLVEAATLQRGYDLPVQDRRAGDVPIYAANGQVGWNDEYKVNGPGVITGRSGTIGKVAFVSCDFWPLNTTLYVKDFHGNSPEFIWRFLEWLGLERFSAGTGVPTLNRNVAHLEKVVIPPYGEQEAIVRILSCLDTAIERTRAVIEQVRVVKQALLADLMTNGLPGRHKKFKTVKGLGRVPQDWRVTRLDAINKDDRPICYGILMPGSGHPGGVPVVKVKDITDNRICTDDLLLTTPELDEQYRRSRLRAGELLLTIRGTTGRVAAIPDELQDANITQDTARVSPVSKVNSMFLYFALQAPDVQSQIRLHTIGQAVKGINIGEVRKLRIPLPQLGEQEQMAALLTAVDARIEQETAQYDQLVIAKQSLSDALLTGKVRVEHKTKVPAKSAG